MTISRRRVLQGITFVSSYAGLNGLRLLPMAAAAESMASPQAAEVPKFAKPEIIRYDSQCFTIHGRDTFIYSACCHYARVPQELWRDRLTKLKQAGFNTIETYVFWNYHEPVEGQADMTKLADFVKLVGEMDMWLITRIGPYACAEWDSGGFPQWILEKQFPLRSDNPESIRTSGEWYSHVLPIVRENMITRGGPIILVQIENEYDFYRLPNQNKLNYMTFLAQTVWKSGVDVPLITNWCRQARENSNPVMAQLMDTCDFYPRWNIVPGVVPALEKLREQEPDSPVSIAELQGGWFSQFGGVLSVDQPGVSGAQFNALAKTVIEHDTTFFSVYMGHGGTSFDWAARGLITSYDYAAPLREPGGVWDKYYATHRLGAFLEKFGPLVVRSKDAPGAATSPNQRVAVNLRTNGKSGVLFVRDTVDAPQLFRLKLSDLEKAGQSMEIPQQGFLSIARRGMKMLAVNVTLPTAMIHYCTAEILTYGKLPQRSYLVVYDDPGSLVELAMHAEQAPSVEGELLYRHYDAANQRAVLGFRMESAQKHLLVNGNLQIVALPTHLADRTWSAQFPAGNAAGGHGEAFVESPVITDCVLMRGYDRDAGSATLTMEYAPGEHDLTILEHAPVTQCTVDGKPAQIRRDQRAGTVSVAFETPRLPAQPIVITEGDYWVESFDLSKGKWITTRPVALETLGQVPYSYVKYRAGFEWHGEANLYLDTLTEDQKQVFLNGTRLAELSGPNRSLNCSLQGRAKEGSNLLEISYEAFGGANIGPELDDLKGIRGIHIGDDQKQTEIASVHVQMSSAAMVGREINPEYAGSVWRKAMVGAAPEVVDLVPAYTWFRARFAMTADPQWFCPWKLGITSDRDALIYVNGKFVGFYRTIGPQSEFYLPEPFVHTDGKQDNIVTVRLAYTEKPDALKQLVIAPYTEYAARKTEIKFEV